MSSTNPPDASVGIFQSDYGKKGTLNKGSALGGGEGRSQPRDPYKWAGVIKDREICLNDRNQ